MMVAIPAGVAPLAPFVDAGVFGPVEVYAADLLTRCAESPATGTGDAPAISVDAVALAAALAVWAPLHGHVCVDLDNVVDVVTSEVGIATDRRAWSAPSSVDPDDPSVSATVAKLPWPGVPEWLAALASSPLVRVADAVDRAPVLDQRPLVLFGTRVFTQRQWVDECAVANELRRRAHEAPSVIDGPTAALIDVLVGPPERGVADQQRAAVESGLSRSLTIVAGGPGTGKTYTIARLLAALVGGGSDVRIGLAAPTGKAAARMTDAIRHAASQIAEVGTLGPQALSKLEACRALTVHRLLGPDHRRTRFAHDATNPLPYDVVIVDETSMVALPLMARLIDAVAAPTRLVLVGDPDQLASIEAGTVLGDIVDAARSPRSPMADVVIRLDRQHRTTADSPIFALAEAIRDQRVDDVVAMLRAGAIGPDGEATLVFHEEDSGLASAASGVVESYESVRDVVGPALFDLQAAAMAGDAARALDALDSQRVLCAHRRGPYGVERWNETLESWMVGGQPRHDHPGRAVLATRNDLRTGVVNGDTGVLVAGGGGGGELRAVFRNAARQDGYARAELDHLELAFALTVHKSQGSEYDTVVLVHPPVGSPLIGRELLYTAVTRARRRLVVIATTEAVAASVCAPSRRVTGLTDALS